MHVTEACGGGVRRHLQLLVPELLRRGLECGIFAFGNRLEPGFLEDMAALMQLGCRVTVVRGASLAAWPMLRRVIREWSPRLIHSHAARGGLLARLCAGHTPVLHSPHGLPPPGTLRHRLLHGMEMLTRRRVISYVLVSSAEQEAPLALGIPAEKCRVVPNGVPANLAEESQPRNVARRTLGLPSEGRLIGVPARLATQKGVDTLLQALPSMRSDCLVVLCGDGPERSRLVNLASSLGVQSKVVFAGHIEGLWRSLRAFDAIVLPSRYEGLSYALLETVALGIPLMASDIPANVPCPELRPYLHLFPPDDPGALAQVADGLLENLEPGRRLASQAQTLLNRQFSLTAQAESLSRIYREAPCSLN
ncbi:MAG: glycosyltransferase [Victivallales bacterium]|nr:glycosyltransferase [Victivallales bacterium]